MNILIIIIAVLMVAIIIVVNLVIFNNRIKIVLCDFLFSSIGLRAHLATLYAKQKVNSYQVDYLLLNTDRKIRRKWNRMLTNPTSSFYIGELEVEEITDNKYRISTGHKELQKFIDGDKTKYLLDDTFPGIDFKKDKPQNRIELAETPVLSGVVNH